LEERRPEVICSVLYVPRRRTGTVRARRQEDKFVAKNEKQIDQDALPSLSLVFGYIAVKDLERREDRVRVLSRLGYGNQDIALICDTTPLTVAVMKSNLKRKKREGVK
jgi:DNA-binding NarL/FixJ family response regulator